MTPYYYVRRQDSPDPLHETLESAQATAEKMAESEPGQVFEILRCVGYSSTSKASTFWVDGEEPPEKPLYRMLEDGDIITGDDEFHHPEGWLKHATQYNSIGENFRKNTHLPHRRPL